MQVEQGEGMAPQHEKSEKSYKEATLLEVKHLDACMELDQLALQRIWSKQQWREELSDSRRLCFGMIENSKLLAIACGWLVIDEIHITVVAVHPEYRRKGLGKRIFSKLLEEAKSRRCSRATLEVSVENFAARSLYKRCGFKGAGQRSNYYKNGSDAIIQWLSFSP